MMCSNNSLVYPESHGGELSLNLSFALSNTSEVKSSPILQLSIL